MRSVPVFLSVYACAVAIGVALGFFFNVGNVVTGQARGYFDRVLRRTWLDLLLRLFAVTIIASLVGLATIMLVPEAKQIRDFVVQLPGPARWMSVCLFAVTLGLLVALLGDWSERRAEMQETAKASLGKFSGKTGAVLGYSLLWLATRELFCAPINKLNLGLRTIVLQAYSEVVGEDQRSYLAGDRDWSELVGHLSEAERCEVLSAMAARYLDVDSKASMVFFDLVEAMGRLEFREELVRELDRS